MAIPFIATLAPRIRRLLPIIQAGVSRGITSRQINDVIKSAEGKGIKRQTLLDVIRNIKNITIKSSQLKFLSGNTIPNINRLAPAITKIRRKLSFSVLVKAISLGSGEIIEQYINVALDTALPRRSIEALAEKAINDNNQKYGLEITSSQIQTGVVAGPLGIL